MRSEAAAPVGHLHVTAPVLFGQMYVAPVVTRFVARHPELKCTLVLLDRMVNLLEEGMDLGIRIGRLEDSSLVAQTIGEVRRVVLNAGSPDELPPADELAAALASLLGVEGGDHGYERAGEISGAVDVPRE